MIATHGLAGDVTVGDIAAQLQPDLLPSAHHPMHTNSASPTLSPIKSDSNLITSITSLPIVIPTRLLQQQQVPLQKPPAYASILPPAYISAPPSVLPVYPSPPIFTTTYYPTAGEDYPNPFATPCTCSNTYQPICGSDENTYSNSCWAACQNVMEFTAGACP